MAKKRKWNAPIPQEDIAWLNRALKRWASRLLTADQRRDFFIVAGLTRLLSTRLRLDRNPSQLATAVLSGFREYQGAVKEPGYHPLIAALTHILETGADDYGWGDEDVELAEKLLQRGTALLQSGEWGANGGDLERRRPAALRARPATTRCPRAGAWPPGHRLPF